MKKLILSILILFLFTGVSFATNVPRVVDPINQKEIWVTKVYNNDTQTADVGDCVEWDIDSSTNNDKNYIVECDSVNTFLTAGIIWPVDILSESEGVMAIRGPVPANMSGPVTLVGTLVCSSAIPGLFGPCYDATGTNANAVGYAVAAGTSSAATVNIFLK